MEQEKKDHEKCCDEHHDHGYRSKPGSLFIPAGVLLGLGYGFMTDNIPAGLFIGLGLGFVAFAVSLFIKR